MTIVNTETIPGKTVVAVKGLVQGNTVRAKTSGATSRPASRTWSAAS